MRAETRQGERLVAIFDVAFVLALLMTFIRGLVSLIDRDPASWVDLIFDDAYYYLGIARGILEGSGSSFLPPFHTNGYQPLWLGLLTLFGSIFGVEDRSMVFQVYVLCYLFVGIYSYLSLKIHGSMVPAMASMFCMPFVMLQGMETVLLPVLIVMYFTYGTTWLRKGFMASLIVLARLDALSLIILHDIYLFMRGERAHVLHWVITASVIGVYLFANIVLFGMPVPVSGLAKSIGNHIGENFMPLWQFSAELLQPLVLLLVLVVLRFFLGSHVPKVPREAWLLLMVSVCNAVYYSLFSGWRLWAWYFWPVLVMNYYLIVALINHVSCYEGSSSPKSIAMASLVYMLVIFVMPAFNVATEKWREPRNAGQPVSWGVRNVRDAEYIKANIGKGAFFAMGDRSGSFGFFLGKEFKFLQTEGLVTSVEYWRALRVGEGLHFLEQQKIDYFIVDRDRFFEDDNVVGIPEPIMGYSYHKGPYLMCFDKYAELFNRKPSSSPRLMYSWESRVQCPDEMQSAFEHLRNQYGGLHGFSYPGYRMPRWADLI